MSTRAAYGKHFITQLVLGNPTAFIYQFFIGKSNENLFVITHFLILNGSKICVNLQPVISHMFYEWNLLHCNYAPFMLQKVKNVYVQMTIQLSLSGDIHKNKITFHTSKLMGKL